MKTTDFITENHDIVQAVVEMHDDHEVQMAREQCYNAASDAIELHRMLKHISERQGLDGWVQEKITLANDYLRQVREWLEHEMMEQMSVTETASSGATGAGGIAVNMNPRRRTKSMNEVDPPSTPQPPRSVNPKIPAATRKKYGGPDWKLTTGDLAQEPQRRGLISHPDVLRRNVGNVK
jgi:hypothetical protein